MVEQLTAVVRKITLNSEAVTPKAVSVEDPIILKAKRTHLKGKVLEEYLDRVRAQGISLLIDISEKIDTMRKIRAKLNDLIGTISQDIERTKNTHDKWAEMRKLKISTLISIGAIANRDSYTETKEALMYRSSMLRNLINDLEAAKEISEQSDVNLLHKLEELP